MVVAEGSLPPSRSQTPEAVGCSAWGTCSSYLRWHRGRASDLNSRRRHGPHRSVCEGDRTPMRRVARFLWSYSLCSSPNPLYLVFDPGFGLSVAATAGLIWLAPIIEMFFFSEKRFWKNAVATTLAAQIAVFPLLLYNTGNFSLVAIPANLLVTALMPLAMGLSALAGFAGMLFGSFAPLLGIIIAFPRIPDKRISDIHRARISHSPVRGIHATAVPVLAHARRVCRTDLFRFKRFSMTLQLRFAKKAST